MRIHIVIRTHSQDRILPRMVRLLAALPDWSVGSKPRKDVDLNYFLAYFEWQLHKGFHATRTATLLTHLEENPPNNAKARLFMQAAKAVDIRVTFCEKYGRLVRPLGTTIVARMPLDLNHFSLVSKPASHQGKPVVGISGYTYKTDRKGQDLVKLLAASPLGRRIELRASGRGWPIPTKLYSWKELPKFFQGLDVLLCPSRVEGGPMPVLEAMASGIPCVIPRDVGLLDELPDSMDLHRYKKGDFRRLCTALEAATFNSRPVNRGALRRDASWHSQEAWCRDHEHGFRFALTPEVPSVPDNLPTWTAPSKCGIYLVAFGQPAREAAKICMKGIKEHLPNVPIALCSSSKLSQEDVLIIQKDRDIGGRSPKIRVYDLAPKEWQYVLYLDVDTEIVSPAVRFYFDLLQNGWEFVIATDPHLKDTLRAYKRSFGQPDYFDTLKVTLTDEALMFNGGVWSFRRCDRTKKFFARWFREWDKHGAKDQGALIRAMYTDPLRVFVLGNEWNYFPKHARKGQETAGIVHYPGRARRWKGVIPGRLDSKEAWSLVDQKYRKKRRK